MRDPQLDPFREGVALLRDGDGRLVGYLATVVERFWAPARPLPWQERVWWLVTWIDGRRERIEEDYPPWILVDEVRHGYVDLDVGPGHQERFHVEWLEGEPRSSAWQRYGILDEIGAYM